MIDLVALGAMKLGVKRLVSKYPLLGGIASCWTLREDRTVGTMGVGFSPEEEWLLYYAPVFVNKLPLDQLAGVLLHEVRHIVYDHVFQTADQFPDENALRIAQETVVNENLPEPLPNGAVLLSQFPSLPPDECTEERYRRLARRAKTKQKGNPHRQGASGVRRDSGKPGHQNPQSDPSDPRKEKSPSGHVQQDDATRQDAQPSGVGRHDRWEELRGSEAHARSIISGAIESLVEREVRPSEYERILIEKARTQRGTEPGSAMAVLARRSVHHRIRWQALLRRFVGQSLRQEPSLGRPPRRYPELVGVIPGKASVPNKPRIMAVIDTSGSMSDKVLEDLSAELLRLSRTHAVHVVECDAVIHRHYLLRKPIKTLRGRGGTSFRPPFRKAFLRKIRPDLVIYLTDGYGDAPTEPPRIPVLWLLSTDAPAPASWGKTIRIPVN